MLKEKSKLSYIFFFIFVAVFILIAIKGLKVSQPGDENTYYYMGKLISEGKVPYKDFFFAHPPLHIYLVALIYKIFGFNVVILKLIPLISTLISAFFIFKITKEQFGEAEAIISSLLFLFSYSIMFNSVFSFGIDIATMFLIIGIYLLWSKKKHFLAGIFFGLAGITRLLTLVPILFILTIILFSDKKKSLKLSSGFLIVFFLVNGIFALLYGSDYFNPVYKFHLLKSFGSKENYHEYVDTLKLNWILFSSAFLFIFVKEKKKVQNFAIISIAYIIFLATLKNIFGFYFIIVFPLLAIIGGHTIVNLIKNYLSGKWKIFILILLLSIFAWDLVSNVMFLDKIAFTGFERGKDIIDLINSASNKETLLFGDNSVVPLLALLTNKKIALDFVDTNNQVFISGLKNLDEVLTDLKGKDILFVIRSTQGLSDFSAVKQFLNTNCDFLSQFHDKIEGGYIIYSCK